ncbi:MAG TPA: hypothetical protein VFY21_07015 [Xanthobacteraceae bacterium]|nr:hypothetical protein [Xanthobacteraceae bacterium]
MAKTPRKTQDPTQAALSAIEEALQMGDAPAAEPAKPAVADDARRGSGALPAAPSSAMMDEPGMRRRPAGRRVSHSPANDDRQSVGQILGALHARPPRMPLYVAAIASAWWMVMALLIGYSRAYSDIAQTSGLLDLIDLPYFWLFFATVVLPPVLFFTIAAMVRRTQEMRLVSRAMTEVTMRLAEPEGVSTDAVVSVSQAIRREVAALGDGIERAIARASELETMVRNEVATLERAYDENELRVRALVDELQSERDAIVSHGTRLREAIGGAHESFSIDVEGVATNIDRTLTEATDRINASLTESTTRITDGFLMQAETARTQAADASDNVLSAFSMRGTELAERLGQVGVEVANALDSRTARLTESMNNSMERLVEAISTKGNEVHEVLTVRLAASEEAIARHGNQIADRIASDTASLAQRVTENVQTFDSTFKEHVNSFDTSLKANVQTFETSLKTHGPALGEQISQAVDYITDQTRGALSSLDERTAGKLRETTEAVDSRIARIEQTIDARTQNLNETLANRTLELARTIADGSKVAGEAVDKTIAGMGEYFATKAQEIATTISDRAESVDQTLGKRALEMTETLDSRIQRFEDQVANKLVGITESIESKGIALTESLVGKLDAASTTLVTKLDETSSGFVNKLESASVALVTKSENVTKSLHEGAAEVERTLGNLSEQITQTLVERTGETVRGFAEQTHQIAATHEALRENVVGSLDKLLESNRLFKQLLQGVTESLEPLENAVAKRVSNLQGALETSITTTRSSVDWIDNQMNELRNISGGVLRDLAAVTQRFEGQGRYIASVAETLSETHGRIDQSLEERREAIEHIIRLLVDRTAEIEENFGDRSQQISERLSAFNRLLQESLATAEQRAQDIARHIIDSTNQISQTINKQHEVIRAGYSEERGRTATALKNTYEEATDEMKQMFSDLQERFTETAREVRDVAGEVQASLDQTRVELKRGVLELPHETRESADAMRRVVADQLKALSELNEIVSRHARDMEAVEPTRATYREDAAAAGGGRYAMADAGSVTSLASARPRAAAPRGEPIEFRRPAREQAEPARRAQRAVPAPREEAERGGWLTDLIQKQDDGEDDDTADTVESLDSLSLDIARMIDHEAAVDLWDRHKRGERNIFTRRLYTPQGQKTFDEIRRRYRKSNEFRETVDRYIDEFERLLDQVSRDDRGQVLSKTYLTSDTGKVYTLLAHAAARLN